MFLRIPKMNTFLEAGKSFFQFVHYKWAYAMGNITILNENIDKDIVSHIDSFLCILLMPF